MKTLLLLPILALTLVPGLSTSFAASPPTDSVKDASDPDMGTAITVIFDNSGSMQGQKIDEAKTAFKAWLSKAPGTYIWSLIDFDDGGRLVVPFGKDQSKVAAAISGFTAHTNTPIVNALKIATRQVVERRIKVTPYERHLVLLFTDGQENQDPGGDGAVLKMIRKMRALNIEVVGIGYHGDGDYLAKEATHYYQADDIEALKAGLNKVDAEVDLGGEIQVSPDDLKAMSQLPPPPNHADDETPDTSQDTTVVAPAPSAGSPPSVIPFPVLIAGVVIIVGFILKAIGIRRR
jgi:uncharacterized protein YegL